MDYLSTYGLYIINVYYLCLTFVHDGYTNNTLISIIQNKH